METNVTKPWNCKKGKINETPVLPMIQLDGFHMGLLTIDAIPEEILMLSRHMSFQSPALLRASQ